MRLVRQGRKQSIKQQTPLEISLRIALPSPRAPPRRQYSLCFRFQVPDLTFGRILRDDMRAFHAASNAIKADEIAARQLHALKQHNTGKLPNRE